MVKLKFRDIESLNAVTGALHKNGYKYSTFIIWGKNGKTIDHYVVEIGESEEDKKKYNEPKEIDFDFGAEDL